MKKVIDRASSRGYFNHGWLKTHHTFSFANYYNPERIHFGALRVLNDDSVDPSMGFDTHPHKNMEVISIPLKGYLRHGDSVQNTKTITPGDIQVMSTGSGIYHSEYNDSKEKQLEFLQIWVFPRIENTKPEYNNFDIRPLPETERVISDHFTERQDTGLHQTGCLVLYGRLRYGKNHRILYASGR